MKVGILQPGYLPWLGFFEQMAKVDTFVVYNNVQYTKKDWRNRNRIKTLNGVQYLTVPVCKVPRKTLTKDVEISYDHSWSAKHINTIRFSYQKAPYFRDYFGEIKDCIQSRFKYLQDLDFALVKLLNSFLGLEDKNLIWSSSIPYERCENKSVNVINICLSIGATYLYDGKSAQRFLDVDLLSAHGVTAEFQNYKHPYYNQLWLKEQGFISHLSVIDLLFNHGPESLAIITGEKVVARRENVEVRNANEV